MHNNKTDIKSDAKPSLELFPARWSLCCKSCRVGYSMFDVQSWFCKASALQASDVSLPQNS